MKSLGFEIVPASGAVNPVIIPYTTDKAGSGTGTTTFTIQYQNAGSSSFTVNLTAPLQDGTTGYRFFNRWEWTGGTSTSQVVTFTVPDTTAWTATAYYSFDAPCQTISGVKWNDLNGNGLKDPGEPGLPGWTINLYRLDGHTEVFIGSTITGPGGGYILTGVQYTDQYNIREILQGGWNQTYPASGFYEKIVINKAVKCYAPDIDFGNRQ